MGNAWKLTIPCEITDPSVDVKWRVQIHKRVLDTEQLASDGAVPGLREAARGAIYDGKTMGQG